jgi:type II secretory pathway pseudopilin PulG
MTRVRQFASPHQFVIRATDQRRRARPAISLVETLVVIAIIAALVGLFLPAVQRVRESSNYIRCRNNLRQIGLAIHTYESANGHFPGLGVAPNPYSVLARVLPYLEQDNLARRFATDQPLFFTIGDYEYVHPAQAEVAGTVVPTFICPSESQFPVTSNYFAPTAQAGTNYVVNAGTGTGTTYDFRFPTDGMFWYGSQVRHKDVTDGLSNTLFVSEALLGLGVDTYEGVKADRRQWRTSGGMAVPATNAPGSVPPLTDDMCMMDMLGMYWRGDRNMSWIGGSGSRTVFNTYLMPNDTMPDCGTFGLGRYKASSGHIGGVNVILGDGSIHFIMDHIDMDTWRGLSTRGSAEVVGEYCGCH